MSKENILKSALKQFTGTEYWYRHQLFSAFTYTDGVKYLAGEAGAYWLLDRIFACQYEFKNLKDEPFQTWEIEIHEDKSATLICTDGNCNKLHEEKIESTDFPIKSFRFYLIDNVLLLPTEY